MEAIDERLMADFGCLDPVYVDGVAGVLNLGANFAMLFYRWAPMKQHGALVTCEQVPAVCIIRPRASLLCDHTCAFTQMLNAQHVPERPGLRQALH